MTGTKQFNIHEGKSGKFYVVGKMGDAEMALPLTTKRLAKMVAHDLNKQLNSYKKELDKSK